MQENRDGDLKSLHLLGVFLSGTNSVQSWCVMAIPNGPDVTAYSRVKNWNVLERNRDR